LHDFGNLLLHVVEARLDHAVRAVGITRIDYLEVLKNLDAKVEVVSARLVGIGAHSTRTEPRSGTVRCAQVEGRADDRDIRLPIGEHPRIGHEGSLGEGQRAAKDVPQIELLAVSGGQFPLHTRTLLRDLGV